MKDLTKSLMILHYSAHIFSPQVPMFFFCRSNNIVDLCVKANFLLYANCLKHSFTCTNSKTRANHVTIQR